MRAPVLVRKILAVLRSLCTISFSSMARQPSATSLMICRASSSLSLPCLRMCCWRSPSSQNSVMRQTLFLVMRTSTVRRMWGWARALRALISLLRRYFSTSLCILLSSSTLMAMVSCVSSLTPLKTLELKPLPTTSSGSQIQFLIFLTILGSSSRTIRSAIITITYNPSSNSIASHIQYHMRGQALQERQKGEQLGKEERARNRQVPVYKPYNNGINGKANSGNLHTLSSKKIALNHPNGPPQETADNMSKSNSNISRGRQSESLLMVDRVVQLHERLKNLHHFYKTRIEDEKSKVSQRNEVFMGIVEELQRSHGEKTAALRKLIEQAEGEKKDVGLVDERMNEIKGSIDEILRQSADLKSRNERLERQINDKAHSLREKEEELAKLKEQLMEARNQLQSFQRLNLKQNKRNKEIVAMIEKTSEAVASNE